MKHWYCWLPWIVLALVAGLSVWQAWSARESRIRDEARILEIDQARARAEQAEKDAENARRSQAAAEEVALTARARSAALDEQLDAAKAKLRAAPTPATLAQAVEQLEDCKGVAGACDARLENEKVISLNLGTALTSCKVADGACQTRAGELEEAWALERKRSDAFKRSYTKQRRRKILGYVGIGAVGVLAGFGIGAVSQ